MGTAERYYRHFKGGIYKFIGIAKFTENPTRELVIYQAMYGEKGIWARPKEMFFSNIERDGYSGPRFKEITEEEAMRLLSEKK